MSQQHGSYENENYLQTNIAERPGRTSNASTFSTASTCVVPKTPPSKAQQATFRSSDTQDKIVAHRDDTSRNLPGLRRRTLVLCFDGTMDRFDKDNSNVVQFIGLLCKENRDDQMVYYQPGIGTYSSPTLLSLLAEKFSKVVDAAIGIELSAHIKDGYKFLMANYIKGDKIHIFGFSRGAYTARALAGMLHQVGLLPPGNEEQVDFAFRKYARDHSPLFEHSKSFKETFSLDVEVNFLGVWDTCSSVGIRSGKRLPFTSFSPSVRVFRHALSLDERRCRFRPKLWHGPKQCRTPTYYRDPEFGRFSRLKPLYDSIMTWCRIRKACEDDGELLVRELDAEASRTCGHDTDDTDVKEVWFAGCHADVGGGAVPNNQRHLCCITLRWMVLECFRCDTGIVFQREKLSKIGLDYAGPDVLPKFPDVGSQSGPTPGTNSIKKEDGDKQCLNDRYVQRNLKGLRCTFSRVADRYVYFRRRPTINVPSHCPNLDEKTSSSQNEPSALMSEDNLDAEKPVYDQLKLHRLWWMLEVLPSKLRHPIPRRAWKTKYWPNLGKPRCVPRPAKEKKIYVHHSVRTKMIGTQQSGRKYTPRATFMNQNDERSSHWMSDQDIEFVH